MEGRGGGRINRVYPDHKIWKCLVGTVSLPPGLGRARQDPGSEQHQDLLPHQVLVCCLHTEPYWNAVPRASMILYRTMTGTRRLLLRTTILLYLGKHGTVPFQGQNETVLYQGTYHGQDGMVSYQAQCNRALNKDIILQYFIRPLFCMVPYQSQNSKYCTRDSVVLYSTGICIVTHHTMSGIVLYSNLPYWGWYYSTPEVVWYHSKYDMTKTKPGPATDSTVARTTWASIEQH